MLECWDLIFYNGVFDLESWDKFRFINVLMYLINTCLIWQVEFKLYYSWDLTLYNCVFDLECYEFGDKFVVVFLWLKLDKERLS